MHKELSENLNLLMAKARINSSELARKIGVPATTIKRLRNNENSNPTITTLLPIAHYFSISLNQLIGKEALAAPIVETSRLNTIPLFSLHECIRYSSFHYKGFPKQIFTEKTVSTKAFALQIDDTSLDFFPKNCILIVDPEKKIDNGDYVIVCNAIQNVTSVRKYIIEIDQVYLIPLINGLAVSKLSSEHKILGVVIQYKAELKS